MGKKSKKADRAVEEIACQHCAAAVSSRSKIVCVCTQVVFCSSACETQALASGGGHRCPGPPSKAPVDMSARMREMKMEERNGEYMPDFFKTAAERQAYKEELERTLPHMKVYLWTLNLKDYGLPQSRNRLFWVGIERDILKAAEMEDLEHPKKCESPVLLRDFLMPHKKMPFVSKRTATQQQNILAYNEEFKKLAAEDANVQCGCCDHSRRPEGVFGEFLNIEDCIDLITPTVATQVGRHTYIYI